MNITADDIIEILEKVGKKKSIAMDFEEASTELTDSKLSGIPYIPEGGEWPVDKGTGNKLYLMLQINFAQVPKMENYPEKGLLQIYVADDDLSGLDFDNQKDQVAWRIIYHENTDNAMDIDDIKKLMPNPDEAEDTVMLPFDPKKEYKVIFVEEEQFPNVDTMEMDKIFEEFIEPKLGIESYSDLDDEVAEEFYEKICSGGSRIGGYPFFTQWEIRDKDDENKLFIQLDSLYDSKEDILMWGDSGVANFFITDEDLKNRNFEDVIYNWDCY